MTRYSDRASVAFYVLKWFSLCPWIICSLKVSRWFLLTRVSLLNGSRNRCRLMWVLQRAGLDCLLLSPQLSQKNKRRMLEVLLIVGFFWCHGFVEKCLDSFERNQWIKKWNRLFVFLIFLLHWPCNKSVSSFYCYNSCL